MGVIVNFKNVTICHLYFFDDRIRVWNSYWDKKYKIKCVKHIILLSLCWKKWNPYICHEPINKYEKKDVCNNRKDNNNDENNYDKNNYDKNNYDNYNYNNNTKNNTRW